MGLAYQWHIKKRIWGSTRRYDQSQTIHGIFTRHIRIIWPRSRYPCGSESAEGLQKQLTALYSYSSLWHIIVSIPKTKVLIFNECYTTVCGSFHYGDKIIEKAEQHKYLGVVYSTKSANNVLKETFLMLLPKLGKQFLFYVNSPFLWSVNCHPLLRWLPNIAHTRIWKWYIVYRRWC